MLRRAPPLVALLSLIASPLRAQAPPPAASSAPAPAASSAAQAPSISWTAAPVPPAPPWEFWPYGRLYGEGPGRPGPGAVRLCSFVAPVCVHGATQADAGPALGALGEAEAAYRFLRHQARLPDPEGDGDAGGSRDFDIYLSNGGYRLGFEVPTRFPYDRAPAYALVGRELGGCARAIAVHRAMASAQLAAVDAAEAGSSFASTSSYLAMMSSDCRAQALEAIDEAQAHPERGLLVPGPPDDAGASPLLLWWLDAALSSGTPGALMTGLWYRSQQTTPPFFARLRNIPDLMATVAELAKGRQTTQDALLLELAIARAFLGERDDGQHMPEAAWLGAAGRVRFDASWAYKSLPRRLAFRPLQPTGMVYAWVDLEGAPAHPTLGVRVTWERPVTQRWALVRVSRDGEEISRMVLTHRRGDTSAEAVVEELENAAGLLIVGINNGEIDLEKPFRLDEFPHESHGGTVHVFVPQ